MWPKRVPSRCSSTCMHFFSASEQLRRGYDPATDGPSSPTESCVRSSRSSPNQSLRRYRFLVGKGSSANDFDMWPLDWHAMLGGNGAAWRATQAITNDAVRPSPVGQMSKSFTDESYVRNLGSAVLLGGVEDGLGRGGLVRGTLDGRDAVGTSCTC